MYAILLLHLARINIPPDASDDDPVWYDLHLLVGNLIKPHQLVFHPLSCGNHPCRLVSTEPFPMGDLPWDSVIAEVVPASSPFGAVQGDYIRNAVTCLDLIKSRDRVPVVAVHDVKLAKELLHISEPIMYGIAHAIHLIDNIS